jgi:hypothetical protein
VYPQGLDILINPLLFTGIVRKKTVTDLNSLERRKGQQVKYTHVVREMERCDKDEKEGQRETNRKKIVICIKEIKKRHKTFWNSVTVLDEVNVPDEISFHIGGYVNS